MTLRLMTTIAGFAILCAIPSPAVAGPDNPVPVAPVTDTQAHNPNIRIDQNLGVQVPLDLVFRDESERPITLREAMQGKVTILVPVYFRCPDLCNKVLNGLLDGLRGMPSDFTAGDKFNVVTVSMDPKEHADLGAPKKARYLEEYGRPNTENGWRFLTGKREPIEELLRTVGYHYEFDKAFKEYKHPSAIIILTPEGKVSRYFLGIGYDDPVKVEAGAVVPAPSWKNLKLSLVEASGGKIGSLADNLLLACSRWEHGSDGYQFQIMRAVKFGGALTLLLVGSWVGFSLWRERRLTATKATDATRTETGTQNGPSGVPS